MRRDIKSCVNHNLWLLIPFRLRFMNSAANMASGRLLVHCSWQPGDTARRRTKSLIFPIGCAAMSGSPNSRTTAEMSGSPLGISGCEWTGTGSPAVRRRDLPAGMRGFGAQKMMVVFRKLDRDDMPAAAKVHRTSFDMRLPWLAQLHTPEEDRGHWSGHLFATCDIWGAERDGALLGIIAFREDWIDQLYILPNAQRQGSAPDLSISPRQHIRSSPFGPSSAMPPPAVFMKRAAL